MADDKDQLQPVLDALRAEHRALPSTEGLSASVLARLAASEGVDGSTSLAADRPGTIDELLLEEQEMTLEALDFADFRAQVMARLSTAPEVSPQAFRSGQSPADRAELASDARPASLDDHLFAEERVTVTVSELLRSDRDAELRRREGTWTAFNAQVLHQLNRGTARGDLSDQAVHLLRVEVEDEVRELSPAFEEGFREEVDRRIFVRGRLPSTWQQLSAWLERFGFLSRVGAGVGLATVAASVALLVASPELKEELTPPNPALAGTVSVDAVAFEGDVMMIPSEGVTMVVLSGV